MKARQHETQVFPDYEKEIGTPTFSAADLEADLNGTFKANFPKGVFLDEKDPLDTDGLLDKQEQDHNE